MSTEVDEAPAGSRLQDLAELVADTPRIVIDRRILVANVRRMAGLAAAAGVGLRPHVKTHKMPQIARMAADAGAVGVQVAKLGEAEVMADAGFDDILVAYPIVGEVKLRRLAALARRARITVSLDSLVVAEGISRTMVEQGTVCRMLVEVDTGLHRIGVQPSEALALARAIARLPAVELVGVLTHEGHIYTAAGSVAEMERMTHEACRTVLDVAAQMRANGIPAPVVSVGSSGTARFGMAVPGITEVRPGTYVFNDLTQVELGAAREADIAACVVATIVSRPAADRAVIDAGTKTLSSDQRIVRTANTAERSFGRLAAWPDTWIIRASEEHGVLGLPSDSPLQIGDRVAILPNHICSAINLHDDVLIAEDGRIVDRWPVAARGRLQ
jgi:D-serine deaminase-like pyridoxal phosphate-dependent protein